MNKLLLNISILFVFFLSNTHAQTIDSTRKETAVFPEIKGYVGMVHPLYTVSGDGNVGNFDKYYTFGMPWGINIWKSKKFGFTFEFTPFIRSDNKGVKMSNFLFHPGILYRLGHEFTLIGRGAFETSGRFGFTPILNKVVYRKKILQHLHCFALACKVWKCARSVLYTGIPVWHRILK